MTEARTTNPCVRHAIDALRAVDESIDTCEAAGDVDALAEIRHHLREVEVRAWGPPRPREELSPMSSPDDRPLKCYLVKVETRSGSAQLIGFATSPRTALEAVKHVALMGAEHPKPLRATEITREEYDRLVAGGMRPFRPHV